jgi:hypothetical protein
MSVEAKYDDNDDVDIEGGEATSLNCGHQWAIVHPVDDI